MPNIKGGGSLQKALQAIDEQEFARVIRENNSLTAVAKYYGRGKDGPTLNRFKYRIAQLKLDTKHFRARPVGTRKNLLNNLSDKDFAALVASSRNKKDMMVKIGMSKCGYYNSYIKNRIKSLNLSTDHFVTHGTGTPGFKPANIKNADEVLVVWGVGIVQGGFKNMVSRSMIEKGIPHECSRCKNNGTWLGKTLKISVHHKNRDWRDNRIENLCFLCPNCKYQVRFLRASLTGV